MIREDVFQLVAGDRVVGELRVREPAGVSFGAELVLRAVPLRGSGRLQQGAAPARIRLDALDARLQIGGGGVAGDVLLMDEDGQARVQLDADDAADGGARLKLAAPDGEVTVHLNGPDGHVRLGSPRHDGDLALLAGDGTGRASVRLDGRLAAVHVGHRNQDGDIWLYPGDGTDTACIRLDGQAATIRVGNERHPGDLRFYPGSGGDRASIRFDGADGAILLYDPGSGQETIRIDGRVGDIRLAMADFAEEFPAAAPCPPGSVVVLGDDGSVAPCTSDADPRVCGVVAGAGGYRPGVIADHRPAGNRVPVALVGKAACWVDPAFGPVRPGSLLVSSSTVGHARALGPADREPGIVLGKALGAGTGAPSLVPVLVGWH